MSESEKQVVHASAEASATNPPEVTANSASTRAGVADATAAATASAAVASSEKTVKTKKKGQKYKYRGAVLMSKSVSALFCKVTEKTLPKSGFKKIHVDGALSRLKWSIEKFMNIYLDFRETFAGRDTDLVRFYLKHRLNGGVWDKVGCLKKMAELGHQFALEHAVLEKCSVHPGKIYSRLQRHLGRGRNAHEHPLEPHPRSLDVVM